MTNRTISDFSRRNLDFNKRKIVEILPEYFASEYPNLIQLLDAYYDFLDSDGSISDNLKNVLKARDIDGVSLDFLDYLLDEIGLGISSENFTNPREVVRNFPDFFRYKGSLFSAKMFFRALYGEEVDISYPKDNLFIVGGSQIGPENLKRIQNGNLHQVLSVLIKSSISITEWEELYKEFVHPVGFYLGSEILIEELIDLSMNPMPDAILDSDAGLLIVSSSTETIVSISDEPATILMTSVDSSTNYRINTNKSMSDISLDSLGTFNDQYPTLQSMVTANQIKFSDSNDSAGIDWSNTFETFDQSKHDSNVSV